MNKAMHRKYRPADFKKRFVWMMVGIVGMGIVLSFLVEVSYGTDPASYFNLALSERTGINVDFVFVKYFSSIQPKDHYGGAV